MVDTSIYTAESWSLVRIYDEKQQVMRLAKVPRQDSVTFYESVMREIQLFTEVKSQWLLTPIACERMNGKYSIVYENFQGIPLIEWLKQEHSLLEIMDIALTLVNAFLSFEQQQLLFNSVNPYYILIHPVSQEIKFISSAYSVKLHNEERFQEQRQPMPQSYFPYIAPEQTGKITARENFSTDLYAFGAVLFELLAKMPPWSSTDANLLLYKILTTQPMLTTEYFIPPTFETIIYKLLMKKQSERYQSAVGLKQDLLSIKEQLETGHFEAFPVAMTDISLQQGLVQQIYGQHQQLKYLEQLVKEQRILTIQGEFGIGKTTLLRSFQQQLILQQQLVAYIDFDQIDPQDEEAYYIYPLRQIMRQLYLIGGMKITQWVAGLKEKNIVYTMQMEQILPELKWFASEQGQAKPLDETVRDIYELLQSLEWPIVILADHVEHLSREQQRILMNAIQSCQLACSHVVLAGGLLEQINDSKIETLAVKPLTVIEMEQWLIDSYGAELAGIPALANYLHKLSNGNPYYIKEFFKDLTAQNIIYFDFSQSRWTIEIDKLKDFKAYEASDLRFLRSWKGLSSETKKIVKQACCLGMQFDCRWFYNTSQDEAQMTRVMQQLVDSNLVHAVAPYTYQFLSRTDFDVIVRNISAEEKVQICQLLIGRLASLQKVDDTNWAQLFLQLIEQADVLAQEVRAALIQKAMEVLARLMERNNTRLALNLIHVVIHWADADYDEARFIMRYYLAQIQYGQSELEQAITTIYNTFPLANNRPQKLKLYELLVTIYLAQHKTEQALVSAQGAFALCQLRLVKSSAALRLMEWQIKRRLKQRTDEALRQLAITKSQELAKLLPIAHLLIEHVENQRIWTCCVLSAVQLSLFLGTAEEKAQSFMYYAIYLDQKNDVEGSKRFAAIALDFIKQQHDTFEEARVMNLYGRFLLWDSNYVQANDYLARAGLHHPSQLQHNQLYMLINRFVKGIPIKSLLEEIKSMSFCHEHATILELYHWLELLEGKSFSTIADILNGQENELTYVLRLKMAYLFNLPDVANQLLQEPATEHRWKFSALGHYYEQYNVLWQLRWLQAGQADKKALKDIQRSMSRLRYLASISPNRYEHTYALIQAEWLNYKGKRKEARRQYHHAAALAKIHSYTLDEAVVYYCLAHFYQKADEQKQVKMMMQQATKVLYDYGAMTLINSWEAQFGKSITQFPLVVRQPGQVLSIDLDAFLQMTQMVMQDLRVNDFIHNVLDTFAKYAGASHGLFLLKDEEGLKVKAKAINTATTIFSNSRPFGILEQYQQEVVLYALQLREPVIVDEQIRGYLLKQTEIPAYGMLCLPIICKNTVRGAILLENHMLSSVFHHHQLGFFQAIITLISVSLENVELYEQLEEIVDQRTEQLRLANQDLQKKNSQLYTKETERKQLFHNISHELRSPITSTIGFIDAILEGVVKDPQKQQAYLNRSKDRLLVLNRLIQDIFDLANLESGRLTFQYSHVTMTTFVEFFHDRYQAEVQSAKLTYEFIAQHLPQATLVVDLMRIEQVVWNLMSNAIKNTPTGSIKLIFTADEKMFYCTVTDNGKGVKKQDQPFIFDSYYKSANVPEVSSTGIGLAICKQIILQHKGEITFVSDEGCGASFTFSLPLHV